MCSKCKPPRRKYRSGCRQICWGWTREDGDSYIGGPNTDGTWKDWHESYSGNILEPWSILWWTRIRGEACQFLLQVLILYTRLDQTSSEVYSQIYRLNACRSCPFLYSNALELLQRCPFEPLNLPDTTVLVVVNLTKFLHLSRKSCSEFLFGAFSCQWGLVVIRVSFDTVLYRAMDRSWLDAF